MVYYCCGRRVRRRAGRCERQRRALCLRARRRLAPGAAAPRRAPGRSAFAASRSTCTLQSPAGNTPTHKVSAFIEREPNFFRLTFLPSSLILTSLGLMNFYVDNFCRIGVGDFFRIGLGDSCQDGVGDSAEFSDLHCILVENISARERRKREARARACTRTSSGGR